MRRGSRLAGAVLALAMGAIGCAQVLDIPDRRAVAHLTCSDGDCRCEATFGDCDGTTKNGCETDLETAQASCGACGNVCQNGACVAGACQCADGFGDCDGDPKNGCEVDLTLASTSCGACGHDCLGGACEASTCAPAKIVDDPGYLVAGGVVRIQDALYFGDSKYGMGGLQDSRIVRAPLTGGPLEVVYDLGPIEVDDFSGDDAGVAVLSLTSLVAFDLASHTAKVLVTDTFDGNYDEMVVAGSDVYYTQGDAVVNTLFRVPRSGGPPATVTAAMPVWPPQKLMQSYRGAPYWVDATGRVATLDAGGAVIAWAQGGPGPYDAFLVNDQAWFAETKGVLERHPLAGGNVAEVPVIDATAGALSILASLGPTLYWIENQELYAWEGIAKRRLAGNIMPFYRLQMVATDAAVIYPQNDGIYRVAL